MSRIEVADGVELHVEIDGSGPDLVTLNGALCSVRQWDGVLPVLAERFRVIRIDVRGIGASSPGPANGYRFEQYSDDIIAVLDSVGEGTTKLWGTAWGARVALVTAARNPNRFSQVVLGDLAIDPADPGAQKAGAAEAKRVRAAAGLPEVAKPIGIGDHLDRQAALQAVAATRLHLDLGPFVELLTVPTLVVTGDHDPNLVSSERALALMADGRLTVLESAGHAALLQRPGTVLDAVLPFLASDGENGAGPQP